MSRLLAWFGNGPTNDDDGDEQPPPPPVPRAQPHASFVLTAYRVEAVVAFDGSATVQLQLPAPPLEAPWASIVTKIDFDWFECAGVGPGPRMRINHPAALRTFSNDVGAPPFTFPLPGAPYNAKLHEPLFRHDASKVPVDTMLQLAVHGPVESAAAVAKLLEYDDQDMLVTPLPQCVAAWIMRFAPRPPAAIPRLSRALIEAVAARADAELLPRLRQYLFAHRIGVELVPAVPPGDGAPTQRLRLLFMVEIATFMVR
jgi:hypothetical protein